MNWYASSKPRKLPYPTGEELNGLLPCFFSIFSVFWWLSYFSFSILFISEMLIVPLYRGNGGVKTPRTYNEDDTLKGYVITLQNFDKLTTE